MKVRHREEAERIHRDLPVVDGHNDLPWAIRIGAGGSLDAADPSGALDGYQTDFPRLLRGGVGAQFWSVFVPAWSPAPFRQTMEQIDLVEAMTDRAGHLTELANGPADADRIRAGRRVAGLVGAEGGHCIEGSLENLRTLRARGVRYLTLTHGSTIEWADSATDEARHGGLTDFGRRVVGEMNRIGMMVDISHVSADTMRDALDVSEAPVIASHSSAFALVPHPRNVPDDVLEAVAAGGGVVMVNFCPAFVVAETGRQALDMFEEDRRLRARFAPDDEAGFEAARAEQLAAMEIDLGTVGHVADHVEHIARVAGVAHVGIGSDFDGVDAMPAGLEDVSCYPELTAELLRRSWPEADVRKVLGGNILRVWRDVEAAG